MLFLYILACASPCDRLVDAMNLCAIQGGADPTITQDACYGLTDEQTQCATDAFSSETCADATGQQIILSRLNACGIGLDDTGYGY